MPDLVPQTSDQSPTTGAEAPPQSRLGIIHLIGWNIGCGIVFALYRFLDSQSPSDNTSTLHDTLRSFGYGIIYGTAICGPALVLWRKVKGGPPFPTAPGHWIMALAGIGFLLDLAAKALTSFAETSALLGTYNTSPIKAIAYYTSTGLLAAIFSLFAFIACNRKEMPLRWKAILISLGLLTMAATCISFTLVCQQAANIGWLPTSMRIRGNWPLFFAKVIRRVAPFGCLPLFAFALAGDFYYRVKRDWLHWTGITIGLCIMAIKALQLAFLWLGIRF